MALLSENRNAAWTAIAALIVAAWFVVYVWRPYTERRDLARAEAERAAQSHVVRGDAQRLASIAELQARADVEAADAEARRIEFEREKRLKKLELKSETLAGHRLGSTPTVTDDNNDNDDNSTASTSDAQSKPKKPAPSKKPKAVLRRTGVNLMSGGDSSSSCGYKPSGSMRNMGGGSGG
jgi:type II secretory pathway component HofQ